MKLKLKYLSLNIDLVYSCYILYSYTYTSLYPLASYSAAYYTRLRTFVRLFLDQKYHLSLFKTWQHSSNLLPVHTELEIASRF